MSNWKRNELKIKVDGNRLDDFDEILRTNSETLGFYTDFIKKYGVHKEIYVTDEVISKFEKLERHIYVAFLNFILHYIIHENNKLKPAKYDFDVSDIIAKLNPEEIAPSNIEGISKFYCNLLTPYFDRIKKDNYLKEVLVAEIKDIRILYWLAVCALNGDTKALLKITFYFRDIEQNPSLYFTLLKFVANWENKAITQIEVYKNEYSNNEKYRYELESLAETKDFYRYLLKESKEDFSNIPENNHIEDILNQIIKNQFEYETARDEKSRIEDEKQKNEKEDRERAEKISVENDKVILPELKAIKQTLDEQINEIENQLGNASTADVFEALNNKLALLSEERKQVEDRIHKASR